MEAVAAMTVVCPRVAVAPKLELFARTQASSARAASGFSTGRNAVAVKVPQHRSGSGRRAVVCMAKETAAAGYAAALLELGKSTKTLESLHTDMDAVAAFTSDPEVAAFLANPVLSDENKKGILKSFASDSKLHSYTLNFLYLLVDKKRINIIQQIVSDFEQMYCNATETQVAVVTSAVKLENSQQALIAKKLQSMTGAKNIKLKNVIEPALIAGFVVKYGADGSQFIDMSVKGQLDRLAEQLELSENALLAV